MTIHTQQPPHGYPPPPGRGNRGLIIGLVVVLVIAVIGVGAFMLLGRPKAVSMDQLEEARRTLQPSREAPPTGQAQPQGQQPEVQRSGQGQPGQDAGGNTQQQGTGPAPSLPQQFAEFTLEKEQGGTTKYVSTQSPDVYVTYSGNVTVDELTRKMGNPENIGSWTCEETGSGKTGKVTCVGKAYEGAVVVTGSTYDYYTDDVASIGDDLLAVWR
ncbi:MAG: hypothetical protein Q4D96_10765 [Propionibacteriaceae bacterium]|nr:hypothetical protein [Propionibacteriaceae bacterium]